MGYALVPMWQVAVNGSGARRLGYLLLLALARDSKQHVPRIADSDDK